MVRLKRENVLLTLRVTCWNGTDRRRQVRPSVHPSVRDARIDAAASQDENKLFGRLSSLLVSLPTSLRAGMTSNNLLFKAKQTHV